MEPRGALQRALEELRRQRAEIESLRRDRADPIAVVGMACRFPGGAETPAAFWDLLAGGVDAVTEVPPDRWNAGAFYDADPSAVGKMTTRFGAFLRDVDQFDPQFFGISPREAQSMDPQQRLLLEVAWEALENGHIAPATLYGTATGVFVGITCFDHAIRLSQSVENFNSYAGTGSALNMAPGRLSYTLGLTGPSMAIDTACSSSLVGLHLACQSLRQRESNVALVGGVHLMLSPDVMVSFSQARMLAPDGRSKTFDASADGYSRGEGCGVVVLKRLADAVADRNTLLGLIRGTAVNQDGPSGGLTVPNGASQQAVIRRALETAGVAACDVAYVEAHGTGTSLGDPIEVESLAGVYGSGRASADPLLIGSVKTNVGHLEPASGMAGLIKILLAFEHAQIPRHLHMRTPNPHIAWDELPVKVVSQPVSWPRSQRKRIAGLSAFGFSGTNAHVIVEEPPPAGAEGASAHAPVALFTLSAKSAESLTATASRYVDFLRAPPPPNLASVCYSVGSGRAHLPYRLAIVASTIDEIRDALRAFAAGDGPSAGVRHGRAASADYRSDAKAVRARLLHAYEQARTQPESRAPFADLATLYVDGASIDWDEVYGADLPVRVSLPNSPFQRQRYWIEAKRDDAPTSATPIGRYRIAWQEVGPVSSVSGADAGRQWAVVSGESDLAHRVGRLLELRGGTSAVVDVREVATQGATDVVYLKALRSRPPDVADSCVELLTLVQELLRTPGAAPRMWIVTRGATQADDGLDMTAIAQASFAAFAKVIGLEHPELFGRLIDLDGDGGVEQASTLVEEMRRQDTEDHVALRNGRRYAPRIERAAETPTGARAPVRSDKTYLITGGFGALGLHVARWLATRGARHLCLVGRHPPATAKQRAALTGLDARGVNVRVATVDVGDRVALTALLADLAGTMSPVAGIVHAAGVPGYVDVADLTAEQLRDVLRPKVKGAWFLHELTGGLPLDFFVCFSSIASAWGSRGQAHYAAANAFLDALAGARRAAGLPAVAINWGPWADGGMNAPEVETLLGRVGVRPLATESAIDALDALAASGSPQAIVADIDWHLFKGSYEARGRRRLLERLDASPARASAATGDGELAARLAAAAAGDREAVAVEMVQAEVAQVLGLPPAARTDPDQGLFEMGMDSLMALELRTRLETRVSRALPATLVFDCRSIRAMAAFLLTQIAGAPPPGRAAPRPEAAAGRRNLADLSDEEAELLLLERLESIESTD